jgi:hypothetical protein
MTRASRRRCRRAGSGGRSWVAFHADSNWPVEKPGFVHRSRSVRLASLSAGTPRQLHLDPPALAENVNAVAVLAERELPPLNLPQPMDAGVTPSTERVGPWPLRLDEPRQLLRHRRRVRAPPPSHQRLKTDPWLRGGFYRRSQHFLGPGSCVVVVSSCREGPGRRPQSARRQRFMELRERGGGPAGCPRGRCCPHHGEKLGAWLQGLPPR